MAAPGSSTSPRRARCSARVRRGRRGRHRDVRRERAQGLVLRRLRRRVGFSRGPEARRARPPAAPRRSPRRASGTRVPRAVSALRSPQLPAVPDLGDRLAHHRSRTAPRRHASRRCRAVDRDHGRRPVRAVRRGQPGRSHRVPDHVRRRARARCRPAPAHRPRRAGQPARLVRAAGGPRCAGLFRRRAGDDRRGRDRGAVPPAAGRRRPADASARRAVRAVALGIRTGGAYPSEPGTDRALHADHVVRDLRRARAGAVRGLGARRDAGRRCGARVARPGATSGTRRVDRARTRRRAVRVAARPHALRARLSVRGLESLPPRRRRARAAAARSRGRRAGASLAVCRAGRARALPGRDARQHRGNRAQRGSGRALSRVPPDDRRPSSLPAGACRSAGTSPNTELRRRGHRRLAPRRGA